MNSMLRWVQLIQYFQQVFDRARQAIEGPDHYHFEPAAAGIGQQLVKTRATRPGAGNLIGILLLDLESPLPGQLPHVVELGFRVLLEGRNP